MATRRIREFLDGNGVHYAVISHSIAFTAQETAESIHIPGNSMAKTVIVWVDGKLTMVVVPATYEVDLGLLRLARATDNIRLAEESDFSSRFVGCQLGTVPPFGNLFGVETLYDPFLARREYMAFTAGTHTDVIVMKFADYNRLVHPIPVRVAVDPQVLKFAHL
jgi:Ala-tRNA(Pro) deacylase